MPELPEVETVIKIVEPLVKGKVINKVDVFYDRLVQSDLNFFIKALIGAEIKEFSRYGKYIFIHLSKDLVLITHLRMEGKFRVTDSDSPRNKFTTALFHFTDGTYLAFDDTRKFGLMYLSTESEYMEVPMIKKLGIEANKIKESDLFTLKAKFNKKKPIKELLLDQSILAGIGNIYADEILYASKINPLTKGSDLNDKNIKDIAENSKIILEKAITLGGSTIHSFHPSEGVDGKFQESLLCYGREGETCPNCNTRFHKIFLGGRGTTYCPNCQLDHELEKAIGVTGPIGSGKSEVLKHFKSKGYEIISADEVVHELYREEYIKRKMSKILGQPFDIDNKALTQKARLVMIQNPEIKKQVEDYIYPLVEKKILKSPLFSEKCVIEVPLLFKAHMEYMFRKIIVLEVSKEKQLSNLEARNDDIKSSTKLNNDFSFDKSNKKIAIIKNDGDLNDLFKKIDSFID